MPLVRRVDPATTSELTTAPAPQPPPESRELLLKWLAGRDADARRRAARALSRDPDAAPLLAARVAVELEPAVREALFDGIVGAGGMPAAHLLAPLLRSPDAGLRGGAVEGLKQLREAAEQVIDALLGDDDADVRLLAVEVTRAWPSALAVPRLRRVLESDTEVNACAAAVDVATEAGTADLLDALGGLCGRFPDEPFLVFAVDVACSRINAAHEGAR